VGKKISEEHYNNIKSRFLNHEEISAEDRALLNIGPWKLNKIQCKKCDSIIISETVHDFKNCFCHAVAVDGGSWYLKRIGNIEDIIELSENYKDVIIEDNKLVL